MFIMEQYINTTCKKKLMRLYKEYDLYKYIKQYCNTVFRDYLKYERHTFEEAIQLVHIWKLQTMHRLPSHKRTIYATIEKEYYEWLHKYYAPTLKNTIIEYITSLEITNTKKKQIIEKLTSLINSYNYIDKIINTSSTSKLGLGTLTSSQVTSKLLHTIKTIKID